MSVIQKPFTFVLIIFMVAAPALARVMSMPFKDAIAHSELIVSGKVIQVIECYQDFDRGNIKIAELEVTQILKGNSQVKRIHFWASPTWVCDISDARDGETLVLLLVQSKERFSADKQFSKNSIEEHLRTYMNGRPLYDIVQSGGGRMIINSTQVRLNSYLDYPEEIYATARRPTEFSGLMVPLHLITTYIKQQVASPGKRD